MQLNITVTDNQNQKNCTIKMEAAANCTAEQFALMVNSLQNNFSKAINLLHRQQFGKPFKTK